MLMEYSHKYKQQYDIKKYKSQISKIITWHTNISKYVKSENDIQNIKPK
jgi:hypothetical protein